MEGGLQIAENEAKKQDKWNSRASSRRLVFVGRLHTSATSPLMKASRRLDLGGISPIMGPRNPGGCYFRKKKAPARNAPVVVGIGFYIKSKIQGILTKRVPFSEKVREAK